MIVFVINVAAALILTALAFFRPGMGIGVALILGRHTFPDRVTPIIAAAPLLCLASFVGYRLSGRALRLTGESVTAVLVITTIVIVGGFRHLSTSNDTIRMLSNDKAFFLMAAVVPLLLLTNALRDQDVRTDFLRSILGISFLMAALTVATGGGDRAGALGGGPITLATFLGISIIVLVHHHDSLIPSELQAFETPIRIGLGLIYLYGIWLTESRQPLLSLVLVLGAGSVAGLTRDRAHAASLKQLRRIRRLRSLSVMAIGLATVGLLQLIFGGSDSRFTLLANPGKEVGRSRAFVWDAGLEMARTAGILGHGFGATVVAQAPEIVFYPHNIFLELFAEVGPVLTFIAGVVMVVAGARATRSGHRLFGLLALYAFLGAQFSGDLYNSRFLFVFLLATTVVKAEAKAELPAKKHTEIGQLHATWT